MEYLITGGAGFVGSHLAEALVDSGQTAVILDDLRSGYMRNLAWGTRPPQGKAAGELDANPRSGRHDLGPDLVFWKGSVTDRDFVKTVMDAHNIDFVFHLAAIVSVPYSVSHEAETQEVNVTGTRVIAECAARMGCRGMAHAGSAAEYGDSAPVPVEEAFLDTPVEQSSPYGKTKYAASRFTASLEGELKGVSLRCFNIYGPRQDPTSQYSGVISKFMDCAAKGEDLPICGDGKQTRDFVYVADVVRAYLFAAGLAPESGMAQYAGERIFNVASGKRITVEELAQTVVRVSQTSAGITHVAERPGDIRHSCASVQRNKDATGWEPLTDLEEGLSQTYAWYKG